MISFIILHYKNINDTIECIKSILNLNSKLVNIIVVDNNSLSNDEKQLILKYTNDLVILDKNLGYAKGNNKGCEYAIKKYKPDFLCVINNDIIINQKNFVSEIFDAYDKTKFDILGPKIITDNGNSVNPFYTYTTIDGIDKQIKESQRLISIYSNFIYRNIIKICMYVKHIIVKPKKYVNGEKSEFNVSLHGCALVFSKKYYLRYQDVFYKETFLYHEEEFLEYRRIHDNLITYYDADLEVFHKEGSSLNKIFNSDYHKIIFKEKERIKSLKLLKEIIISNRKI